MKLREIKALRGPNYWSQTRHNLIVMLLDLKELEFKPTNKIDGFYDRLKELMPSLHEHTCSEGVPGGFFKRVYDGTWMGHVIEHIAIEIQILSGMYCPFGKTRSSNEKGVYHVVFEYRDKEAGVYAAKAALAIAEALITPKPCNLKTDIDMLCQIRDKNMLGPSSQALVFEAESRNIPCRRLDDDSLVMMGQGNKQKLISAAITSSTSSIGVDIACNKQQTKRMLENARIPIPKGKIVRDADSLLPAANEIGYPLVVKPVNGNHGRGASINLTNKKELIAAFHKAKKYSDKVMVEKLISGVDYRILIVNNKFIAAAQRTPASVTGNGHSTVRHLIEETNNTPNRGCGHEKELTKIKIDDSTHFILDKHGYTLDSIPENKAIVHLKSTANLSTGGTGIDITDSVHPYNIALTERVSRIIGLDICGIDIVAPCLTIPVNNNGGAVIEVNAEPGLRMHLMPSKGRARNVAKPVIDMLFPENETGRIPVTAVTGTNGKTTTSRLIAHLASTSGYFTGLTTTDGIYINGKIIEEGDCSGPDSAEIVLREPEVNYAVLECARGGILRGGLGFSNCDIGIVTNILEDHLGIDDIHSLEQMTRVKNVIPKSIRSGGYAILNADDDLVYNLAKDLNCNIALFSMKPANHRIISHCQMGGLAAFPKDGFLVVKDDEYEAAIAPVEVVPLTFGGKAGFNIQNILAAILTGYISNFGITKISEGLKTFVPSALTMPGRMNLFNFSNFDVLVDYAHNPSSIDALGWYVESFEAVEKTGVITAVGDRRDQDIITVGRSAARIFDQIIIKHDKELRGRTRDEITMLLLRGISQVEPQKPVKIIPSETEAVRYAIENAKPGSLITALTAEVQEVLSLIHEMMEKQGGREKVLAESLK